MKKKLSIVVFFLRMFSSVGFAVLYASMAIFLLKNLHQNGNFAISIVGIFIALHYSLALLNGYLVGKWISNINAFIIGTLLQAVALKLIYGHVEIYYGLAIFLGGSFLNSVTLNMIITERYEALNHDREKAFMWNYAAQNLGNVIGFTIAGYMQLYNNSAIFGNMAICFLGVAVLLGLIVRKSLDDIHTEYFSLNLKNKIINFLKLLVVLCVLIAVVSILLKNSLIDSTLLLITLLAIVGISLFNNFKKSKNKQNAAIFIILAFAYMTFWSLYFLIPTGLSVFASFNTNMVIYSFVVPTAWLPNINSGLIIVCGPILGTTIFQKINQKQGRPEMDKFIIGFIMMGLAFLALIVGISIANFGSVALLWLVLTYVFLTFSELFIAPVGFASVGKYIDRSRQSTMTGVWLSLLGIGALISSKLSTLVDISTQNLTYSDKQFLELFIALSIISTLLSIIIYASKKKMISNSQNIL